MEEAAVDNYLLHVAKKCTVAPVREQEKHRAIL